MVKKWVDYNQSSKQWLKILILPWKDENINLGKILTFSLIASQLGQRLISMCILIILTLKLQNEIIYRPIGINSII